MEKVQPPSQDRVGIALIERSELIDREAHVGGEIRHDAFIKSASVQHRRNTRRTVALVDQGLHLIKRQRAHFASIREYDHCRSVCLIDSRNNVALRDQCLHLKRVHLAKADSAFQKNEHWVVGFCIGHRRAEHCVGGDVFELPEQRGRQIF